MPPTPTDPPADEHPEPVDTPLLARTFRELDRDTRFAWTTRRRNRLLLLVTQGSFLTLALVLLLVDRPGWALLAVATFFPLMGLINIGTHGLLEIPDGSLDDVMRLVRAEARARAYTILVTLLGLVLVLAPFAANAIGERFAEDPAQAIIALSVGAAGLFFAALVLPSWVLAWRLPDLVLDDRTA